jgi:O-antigen biosynthesis protein WbqP
MSKGELQRTGVETTRLGRTLRRYSLDELPQLLNVVVGDMTLVGPRPALYTQEDLIAMRAAVGILHARPGMTGLAQISGREELTLDEKVALDAEYVRRMSPTLDVSIAVRTARAVFQARGSF